MRRLLYTMVLLLALGAASGQTEDQSGLPGRDSVVRFVHRYIRDFVVLKLEYELPDSEFAVLFASGVRLKNDFDYRDPSMMTPGKYYQRLKFVLLHNPYVRVRKIEMPSQDLRIVQNGMGYSVWIYKTLIYDFGRRRRRVRKFATCQVLWIGPVAGKGLQIGEVRSWRKI